MFKKIYIFLFFWRRKKFYVFCENLTQFKYLLFFWKKSLFYLQLLKLVQFSVSKKIKEIWYQIPFTLNILWFCLNFNRKVFLNLKKKLFLNFFDRWSKQIHLSFFQRKNESNSFKKIRSPKKIFYVFCFYFRKNILSFFDFLLTSWS